VKGRIPTRGWNRRGSSTLEYVIVIAAGILLAGLLHAVIDDSDIDDLLREKVIQAINGKLTGAGKEIAQGDFGYEEFPEKARPPGIPPDVEQGEFPGVSVVSSGGSEGIQGETALEVPSSSPETPPPTPKEENRGLMQGLKTVGNVSLDFIGYYDAKAALTGVDENGKKIGWGERILRGAMVLPLAKPVKGARMAVKYGDDVLRFTKGKLDEFAMRMKKTACACPKDPFEVAKNGGKHYRMYKDYLNKTDKELEKGIRSFEKQIRMHQDKIKNPKKYIKEWDDMDPRKQKNVIAEKWPNDIKRHKEQKRILEGILEERQKKKE